MLILITGDGAKACAEGVRNRLSYIGHPVINYDFEEPCGNLHDAAMLALQQYKDIAVLPVKNIFDGPRDDSFMWKVSTWLEASGIPLSLLAKGRIKELTARWEELGMLYTVIVYGNIGQKDIEEFPDAYKVFLDGSKKEYYLATVHFNDCAVSNIFDQVVDTSKATPEEAVTLISTSYTDKIKSSFNK
jgi:hypothetical protein